MVALTPIQTLENAVRDAPAIPELYLQLAELYVAAGREYDAERMLTKGQAATDDPRVRTRREEITMLRLEGNVSRAQQGVEARDSPDSRAMLTDARLERDRVELEIFQDRVRLNPADAEARYELGRRLKRAGRLREAYVQFHAARSSERLQAAVALELGECLRDFGDYADALTQFRLAARTANPAAAEIKKLALWQAVGICRRVKLGRLAERYLNELDAIDPKYGELMPGQCQEIRNPKHEIRNEHQC